MKRTPLKRKTPLRAKSNKKKVKRTKRTKLTSLKVLKRKAWQAIAAYIRRRDPFCVTCGNPTTDCGHYRHNSERSQALGGNALWYDERNLNGQCTRCNCFQSGALDRYALFLEEKHGKGILQELNKLYLTPKKWTREEIEKLTRYYEGKSFDR